MFTKLGNNSTDVHMCKVKVLNTIKINVFIELHVNWCQGVGTDLILYS